MELRIRQAEPDDAEALLALVRRLLSQGPVDVPMEPDEFRYTVEEEREILADTSASENSVFLVAESGGRLIGELSLRGRTLPTMRHSAGLGMSVAADARGQGAGRALLEAGVAWARASRFLTRIVLDVYVRNTRARHLYESVGFRYEVARRCSVVEDGLCVDSKGMGLLFEDKSPEPVVFVDTAYRPAPAAPADASVRVRDARPEDAPGICRMYAAMRRDPGLLVPTTAMGIEPDVGKKQATIERARAANNSFLLVAEAESGIVGSVEARGGTRRALQHEAFVSWDVADGWRRRGIGRRLTEGLLERARAGGVLRRLELVVYAENEAAIGLYESCGFEHEGRRRGSFFQGGRYYDDLLMARLLD